MEGGAVDFNGAGTVLTTTSCLLNKNRNPRSVAARRSRSTCSDYYGQRHVVWLGDGIAGDDTDGHIDDLARFVGRAHDRDRHRARPATIRTTRCCATPDGRLDALRDQDGRPFTIVELPMPRPVVYRRQRLPATYMNFYFVNGALLVPTFGQKRTTTRARSRSCSGCCRSRRVVGVDCRALIWGLGAIHCLTQQQPLVGAGKAGRAGGSNVYDP